MFCLKDKKVLLFSDYQIKSSSEEMDKCISSVIRKSTCVPRNKNIFTQIYTQLGYIGAWFWCGLILIMLFILYFIYQIKIEMDKQHFEDTLYSTLALLSCTGPLLSSMSAPILSRSYSHGMWELEEASFYNLPHLTALRLSICAVAALPVLLVIFFASSSILNGLIAICFICTPFLLSSAFNYIILSKLRGHTGIVCCFGCCLLMIALSYIGVMTFSYFSILLSSIKIICILSMLLCSAFFILCAKFHVKNA